VETENVVQVTIWNTLYFLNSTHTLTHNRLL